MARSMSAEASFIVSDLHLGSEHFHHCNFLSFLDSLPRDAGLILNGDIIDDPSRPLCAEHQSVLERLIQESWQRPLVWVYGNHDANIILEDAGQIRFAQHWEIDRHLLIVHGDDFDEIMPRHGLFRKAFKIWHGLRTAFGFRKVHVAEYAKKWEFLYRVLNEHVAHNALQVARSRGFQAVTCGHTHAVMELDRDGVRYFNTGAWTEKPLHYIVVDATGIDMHVYEDGENG